MTHVTIECTCFSHYNALSLVTSDALVTIFSPLFPFKDVFPAFPCDFFCVFIFHSLSLPLALASSCKSYSERLMGCRPRSTQGPLRYCVESVCVSLECPTATLQYILAGESVPHFLAVAVSPALPSAVIPMQVCIALCTVHCARPFEHIEAHSMLILGYCESSLSLHSLALSCLPANLTFPRGSSGSVPVCLCLCLCTGSSSFLSLSLSPLNGHMSTVCTRKRAKMVNSSLN